MIKLVFKILLVVVVVVVVNPRRACAARVMVVAVSVCLLPYISLHELSIAPQTIPRIQHRIKVERYMGFSQKLLRSVVTA